MNNDMRENIVWGIALLILSPLIIISFIISCMIYIFNHISKQIKCMITNKNNTKGAYDVEI